MPTNVAKGAGSRVKSVATKGRSSAPAAKEKPLTLEGPSAAKPKQILTRTSQLKKSLAGQKKASKRPLETPRIESSPKRSKGEDILDDTPQYSALFGQCKSFFFPLVL